MSLNNYIAKQFSNPIGVGGKLVSFVMNRQNHPLYEETIRLLALSDNDSVLDIGCGNGYVLKLLARQYNCKLSGIDSSASIIKTAYRKCRKYIESGVMMLSCQNVNTMSLADNSFDKVYTINTVYFWENLDDVMVKIRHVLKPNGLFINTLYTNETLSRFTHTQFGYKRFTAEQLRNSGSSNGFDVSTIPIMNGAAYCVLYHLNV